MARPRRPTESSMSHPNPSPNIWDLNADTFPVQSSGHAAIEDHPLPPLFPLPPSYPSLGIPPISEMMISDPLASTNYYHGTTPMSASSRHAPLLPSPGQLHMTGDLHYSPSFLHGPALVTPTDSNPHSISSPSSPTTPRTASTPRQSFSSHRRHFSARSTEDNADLLQGPKHRACDRCRQQKQKCDVQHGPPFVACTRCSTGNMGGSCQISDNFQRIGKRKRNQEIEDELGSAQEQNRALLTKVANLEKQLQVERQTNRSRNASAAGLNGGPPRSLFNAPASVPRKPSVNKVDHCKNCESNAAAGMMLALSQSPQLKADRSIATPPPPRRTPNPKPATWHLPGLSTPPPLDDIPLLIEEFMRHYQPYLPIVDPARTATELHKDSELLFWVIVSVAARRWKKDPTLKSRIKDPLIDLIWRKMKEVSRSHYDVKALCILCTWPLPNHLTSMDPTYTFCGIMMQIAYQIGLHRPTHRQDFSTSRSEALTPDLNDRVLTWAACNIVGQTVCTGYGLPSNTLYDYTLDEEHLRPLNISIPEEIRDRLEIEELSDEITRAFYCSYPEKSSKLYNEDREAWKDRSRRHCRETLEDLKSRISSEHPVNYISLLALEVHFALANYHTISPSLSLDEKQDIMKELYRRVRQYLMATIPPSSDKDSWSAAGLAPDEKIQVSIPDLLQYCPHYLYQMILVCAFVIWKLSTNPVEYSDRPRRRLSIKQDELPVFKEATSSALRTYSVTENDLPVRFCSVLHEMYERGHDLPDHWVVQDNHQDVADSSADQGLGFSVAIAQALPLENQANSLDVKCRASMSLVHDTVWKWRVSVQAKGKSRIRPEQKDLELQQRLMGKQVSNEEVVHAPRAHASKVKVEGGSVEKLEEFVRRSQESRGLDQQSTGQGIAISNIPTTNDGLIRHSSGTNGSCTVDPTLFPAGTQTQHASGEASMQPRLPDYGSTAADDGQQRGEGDLDLEFGQDPPLFVFDPVCTFFDDFNGSLSAWLDNPATGEGQGGQM